MFCMTGEKPPAELGPEGGGYGKERGGLLQEI